MFVKKSVHEKDMKVSLVKALLLAFAILHAENREKQSYKQPQNTLKKNMV